MASFSHSSSGSTSKQPSILQKQANDLNTRKKVLQDNIHGKIVLHPVCVRIINTPQFDRLRHIKQIGTCYYVYPTACHNRFEHSIGVCYLAGKLLRAIKERQPDENITDADILCVEIAGLCHELGQGPWSHFFEKHFLPEMKIKFSPKATARKMFEYMLECDEGHLKKDITRILKECHFEPFKKEDFDFIKELIDDPKDIETGPWPYEGRPEEKSFLYEIIQNKRNGVDVNKWDYLARDSHMLGLKVTLDYERCFASARVILCDRSNGKKVGEPNAEGKVIVPRKQICYRDKNAMDLHDMFYTRYNLHKRAYEHKTHSVIGIMISDAMKEANDYIRIGGKKITETVDDMKAYTLLTDEVVQLIMNTEVNKEVNTKVNTEVDTKMYTEESNNSEQAKGSNKDKSRLRRAHDILLDIMHRRFYKCVSEAQCKDKGLNKNEILDEIKKLLKGEGVDSIPDGFMNVIVVELNYGLESRNPLEKIQFYKKDRLDEPFKFKKDQVLFVLPDTFEERIIRIYCNVKDDSHIELKEKVQRAFQKWCPLKGYSITKGETDDQTIPKAIYGSSQQDPCPGAERSDDIVQPQKEEHVSESESAPLGSVEQLPSYDGENIDQRSSESEDEPSSQ